MKTLLTIIASVVLAGPAFTGEAARPNILFILADDMGYSDAGCFGGEIKTPALDRLASSGLVVSRFHNGGMCVVSRLSLMTGRWWPSAQREFGSQRILPEVLREKGYRTALIGKWHLAGHPMDRGFDRFYGFLGGFADHFSGSKDFQDDRVALKDFGPGYYSSSAFSKEAAAFIDGTHATNPKQPLFLYLCFQAPHNPLERLYKISQHAGGITAGGTVHWPAGLKQPGRTSHSPVHLIDVMPTLLDAIGVAKPTPCDGESFLPLIRNAPWTRNGPMFFQFVDNRAIRTGSWTLAEVDGNGWELFDTRKDPLECHDLSASNPERVSKLETEWLNWWQHHSGKNRYQPESTKDSPHYSPQGDRGSGKRYTPSSMSTSKPSSSKPQP